MELYLGTSGLHVLLNRAMETGASDVHVDPDRDVYRIRYRIQGKLVPAEFCCDKTCIQALKLMAHIDLSERKAPGDGHFTWGEADSGMEIRVSIIPTIAGPKFALRCLPLSSYALPLHALGFQPDNLQLLHRLMFAREGLMLASGATGSGKTTTLYAMMIELQQLGLHVVTLENPVERRIAGVTQIEIGAGSSLSFADGIRAVLRQDPNVIMIGEIRDETTAHAAVQAALTGHLVFSSVHAADALRSIVRLLELGVHPLFLQHSLLAVISHEFRDRQTQLHPQFAVTTRQEITSILSHRPILFEEQEGNQSSMLAERGEPFGSSEEPLPKERSSAFVRGWLDYSK